MKPPPKGWPRISSSVHYKDPAKAIDWLCRAFGFEVQLKIEADGRIHHSELTYGEGMIMVGGEDLSSEKGRASRSPLSVGGANTQSIMVFVDDARAHCERARAAGATVTEGPEEHDYGEEYWADLSYGCKDLEGHLWWFVQRLRDPLKPKSK
jgi:uncharacterized glyoxalase superfamily protein PhnB